METEYTLKYFTFKGKAEVIRLLFVAAGIDYKDERLKCIGNDWEVSKAKTPMKIIPLLTIRGKGGVCGSTTIARYLAKKFGLFGSNHDEELIIDEVVECVKDMVVEVVRIFYEKDDTRKVDLERHFLEVSVPNFVEYVRLRLKDGENGFLVGSKMSLADISVFDFIDQQIERGYTCFHQHTDIMRHYELIKSNPGILQWLQKRPPDIF